MGSQAAPESRQAPVGPSRPSPHEAATQGLSGTRISPTPAQVGSLASNVNGESNSRPCCQKGHEEVGEAPRQERAYQQSLCCLLPRFLRFLIFKESYSLETHTELTPCFLRSGN